MKGRQRQRARKRDLYRCLWRLGSPSLPTRLEAYTFFLREAKEMRDEVRDPAGTRDQRGIEGRERRERKRDGCRSGVRILPRLRDELP